MGNIDGAITIFRSIVDHAPPAFAGSAAFGMGHLLHQKGDIEACMKALRQAVVSAPPMHRFPASVRLGALLAMQGDNAAAVPLLRSVAESRDPEHAQSAELCLGQIYQDAGDTASARAAYRRAAMYGDPRGRMSAEQALRSLLPVEDDIDVERTAMALAAEGERLFGSERYEEALAACRRAIEISRSLACTDHYGYELFLAAASNNVGMCLRKLRRLHEAERAFREAADICQRRWSNDADLIGDMYTDVLESHAAVLSASGIRPTRSREAPAPRRIASTPWPGRRSWSGARPLHSDGNGPRERGGRWHSRRSGDFRRSLGGALAGIALIGRSRRGHARPTPEVVIAHRGVGSVGMSA